MLKLSVSSHLEIAHYMPDFPEGHPNRRMHGHSYFVTVTLESREDTDMIEDLEVLQTKVEAILKKYDHTCANDWDLPTPRPTMENLCRFLWRSLSREIPKLSQVMLERPTLGMKVFYEGNRP